MTQQTAYTEDLSNYPIKHGMRISCYMDGKFIPDAMVIDWENTIYICQNLMHGNNCPNKAGYKFSWSVGNGTYESCDRNDVHCVRIKNTDWDD